MTHLTHRQADGTLLASYRYELDGLGNATRVTETLAGAGATTTRIIINTYDALNRQTVSAYSTGESFAYRFDTGDSGRTQPPADDGHTRCGWHHAAQRYRGDHLHL